jgi:hypothetical protein
MNKLNALEERVTGPLFRSAASVIASSFGYLGTLSKK